MSHFTEVETKAQEGGSGASKPGKNGAEAKS